MGVDQQGHRAGALKQKNKVHKTGRHRSKGAIDNELKGSYSIFTVNNTSPRDKENSEKMP